MCADQETHDNSVMRRQARPELPNLSYSSRSRTKRPVIFSPVVLFIITSVSMDILLNCKFVFAFSDELSTPLNHTTRTGASGSSLTDPWDQLVSELLDHSAGFNIWCDSMLAKWAVGLAEPNRQLRYRRSAHDEHEFISNAPQQPVVNETEDSRKQLASRAQFYRFKPLTNVTHMPILSGEATSVKRDQDPLLVARLGLGSIKDEPSNTQPVRSRHRQRVAKKASTEPITLESYHEPTETPPASAESPLDVTTTESSLYQEDDENRGVSAATTGRAVKYQTARQRNNQRTDRPIPLPVSPAEPNEETASDQHEPDWATQGGLSDQSVQQLDAAINNMSDDEIRLLLESSSDNSGRKTNKVTRASKPSQPQEFSQRGVSAPYLGGLSSSAAQSELLSQRQLSHPRQTSRLQPGDSASSQQLASLVEEKFYADLPLTTSRQREKRARLPIKSPQSRPKVTVPNILSPSQPLTASSDYLAIQEAPGSSSLQPAVFHSDANQPAYGGVSLQPGPQSQILGLLRAATVPGPSQLAPFSTGLAQQAAFAQLTRRLPLIPNQLTGNLMPPIRYNQGAAGSAAAGSTLSHSYMPLASYAPIPLSSFIRPGMAGAHLAGMRAQSNVSQHRNSGSQHRIGRVAETGGASYDDSPSSAAGPDPMWSDTQNQQEDYQQSPQTIQITAVPNGVGLNNGWGNGFGNGWNGWGPWNGRQVLLVNRQPQSEWRQWVLPVAAILALPLILGALFVPVFLKSVMFLIQILQMLGLLLPPSQLAGHLSSSAHSSTPG